VRACKHRRSPHPTLLPEGEGVDPTSNKFVARLNKI
jgi:hypothetical protein